MQQQTRGVQQQLPPYNDDSRGTTTISPYNARGATTIPVAIQQFSRRNNKCPRCNNKCPWCNNNSRGSATILAVQQQFTRCNNKRPWCNKKCPRCSNNSRDAATNARGATTIPAVQQMPAVQQQFSQYNNIHDTSTLARYNDSRDQTTKAPVVPKLSRRNVTLSRNAIIKSNLARPLGFVMIGFDCIPHNSVSAAMPCRPPPFG